MAYNKNSINGGSSDGSHNHATRSMVTNLLSQRDPIRSGPMTVQPSHSTTDTHLTTFECSVCHRQFTTKTGLGVHNRRAHPVAHNEAINIERTKRQWTDEEVRLLAASEAKAIGVKNINQHLAKIYPHRSLEAIKGKRRNDDYKTLVAVLQTEMANNTTSLANKPAELAKTAGEQSPAPHTDTNTLLLAVRENIDALQQCRKRSAEKLCKIAEDALRGQTVDSLISDWLTASFPRGKHPKAPQHTHKEVYSGNCHTRRRQRYARVQKLFENNLKAATRVILNDSDSNAITLPNERVMVDYWKKLFSGSNQQELDSYLEGDYCSSQSKTLEALWYPITEEEVRLNSVGKYSAPGLDGIQHNQWKAVNNKIKQLLFNLFLLNTKTPDQLIKFRTILLPKNDSGSDDPGQFRPITIGSIILRHFHKILAKRFTNLYKFDTRQKGFLPVDGICQNIAILTALLDEAKHAKREIHLIITDVAKAFDSYEHTAIYKDLMSRNFPLPFVKYMKSTYSSASTLIQYENLEEMSPINKGVLQGDPLSAPIFNVGMESGLKQLSDDIGFDVGSLRINASAYADDNYLVSGTVVGGQRNLDAYVNGLSKAGLTVNAKKSAALSVVPSGKQKKMKVVTQPTFRVGQEYIPQISVTQMWKYLGVSFEGPELTNDYDDSSFYKMLEQTTKAPLKPQQRIKLLKSVLIPRMTHRLTLGKSRSSTLKKLDVHSRSFVRRWLHLPKDVCTAFFHAPTSVGGLGIPCLQQFIPLCKYARFNKLAASSDPRIAEFGNSRIVRKMINCCQRALNMLGPTPNKAKYQKYWAEKLYLANDGKDLIGSDTHKSSTEWVSVNRKHFSGRDYIQNTWVKINALPTKVRLSRGRPDKDTTCRAGCSSTETAYHVIQECFRSHGGRLLRHNRVVDLLAGDLSKRYVVDLEPKLVINSRLLKPDIIAVLNDSAYVLDPQIVNGSALDYSARTKVKKYRDIPDFDETIKAKYKVASVVHLSCTITYKGVWAKRSIKDMKSLGLLDKTLHYIVTSVLKGSYLNFVRFQQTTAVGGRRRRS